MMSSARRSLRCDSSICWFCIATDAWNRNLRAPSYSITTSISGGALSTALSR